MGGLARGDRARGGAGWAPDGGHGGGGRVALRDADTGRTVTYAALAARAEALAGALAARGVGRGDRVAVLSRGRPEVFELLAACARLGAILAPLSWRATARELAVIAADCAPAALVHDAAGADDARALVSVSGCRTVVALRDAGGDGIGDAAGDSRSDSDDRGAETAGADVLDYEAMCAGAGEGSGEGADGDADAGADVDAGAGLLLYTSGTTGTPKGALLSWRQIEFNARATASLCGLGPDDSTLVFLPLFHTGGLNCLATPLLSVGGQVVVTPAFEPARALDIMAERQITAIIAVPTIYEALLDAGLAERALPRLRWLLVGGAPCPDALVDAYDRAGHPLNQGYGLTEVGPNCFTLGMGAPRGSVGVPVPGSEARLVTNRDGGRDDRDGDRGGDRDGVVSGAGVGELCLRGPHVTLGYWNRPAETAAVLSGDGWFRTGDIARRDAAGFYAIVGRVKDMYISGGENVYPAEIERVVGEHPDIAQVAVVGVADPRWGEVGLAVCVPAAGAAPTPEQLRAWTRERLAGYKVPRHWRLVSALPLTTTGKIAKAALREQFGSSDSPDPG